MEKQDLKQQLDIYENTLDGIQAHLNLAASLDVNHVEGIRTDTGVLFFTRPVLAKALQAMVKELQEQRDFMCNQVQALNDKIYG